MQTEIEAEVKEKEFVKLLVKHQSLIRAFVISLLPGMSETEDVIQNTNEVLWAKREQFELGTNFKAWALSTARFQAMAFLQKLKRGKMLPLDEDVMLLVSEEASNLEAEEMNRQFKDLNDCIGLLQMKDQELILHRYWKKTGLQEYSKASERSVGSLKVALYRIRTGLRRCLDRKSEGRGELA